MSVDELDELDRCERAFANADQAQWMRGMALHAVRDRRLYRDGGRTWAQYCEEVGLSESDANRMIQEYPLSRAIAQIWVTPKMVPASHVRALLPLESAFGLERTANGYVQLRQWAQNNGQRVTAADLSAIIERSAYGLSTSDGPLPVAEFLARRTELEAGVPPQAGPPRDESSGMPSAHITSEPPSAAGPGDANLGDSAPAGNGHPQLGEPNARIEEVVDGEIVDDRQARALSAALAEFARDINSRLAGASTETLKGIAASARSILETAENAVAAP
ncbi:hypothetical protein [Streptomyces sp. NRRL F-2664]|uniref:hypothetical protein n=1 Tax=Streptomyces sp. NRRL F-2664 TaxID=1463842 RepID=UPI00131ED01B|nr:hypothetical protein [Streptomyces sp. NRRL F-2664]